MLLHGVSLVHLNRRGLGVGYIVGEHFCTDVEKYIMLHRTLFMSTIALT